MERTPDGHHVVIKGREWRATDPLIPEEEAGRLRKLLMEGRRRVGAALRAGDKTAEKEARALVQRAKVGLGERGEPWWEQSEEERRERWEGALE